MKGHNNRFYREGCPHHLYLKALEGNVLFYKTEDYLLFLTLLYVLAKRYGIKIEAVCIMFNHAHIFIRPAPRDVFEAFLRDLQAIFAKRYNEEYHCPGPLMMPGGYAPKVSRKGIVSCLIYILNNPVAGRLVHSAAEYKWNLLAYHISENPFSKRLVKRESRSRMRRALQLVDVCFDKGEYLSYSIQKQVFKGLTLLEKKQAVDYIVNKYYPSDKDVMNKYFGGYETATIALRASAGSEHDMYEAWEDYSVYARMLRSTMSSGVDHHNFRFHEMDADDLTSLAVLLSGVHGSTPEHLKRFLHLT